MYDVLATYYDVLHRELTEDVPLALALAAEVDGAVLELGCGTGRLMGPLVAAGVRVVGVDNSAEMLAIARAKIAAPLAKFVQADMTTLSLSEAFALCVISHNTLMHLNQAQLNSTLQRIAAHLQPNGRLLIDVENPFAMAAIEDEAEFYAEEAFVDPRSGLSVTPYARWQVDLASQITQVSWRYVREDGESVSAEIAYHYHFPHTIQQLLSKHGLRLQTTYGDYDRPPFEEDSPRLILIATKPHEL